ncbi:TPA: DUF4298 domain-containing protein [Neisseria gonorrhoeae]
MKKEQANTQKRIDEIQSKYREWCHLLLQLEENIHRWKYAVALIRDMDNFYTHEYQVRHQTIKDGVELNLQTEGEYSIMSEDALWNAPGEFHQLAWLYLCSSVDTLDRYTQEN